MQHRNRNRFVAMLITTALLALLTVLALIDQVQALVGRKPEIRGRNRPHSSTPSIYRGYGASPQKCALRRDRASSHRNCFCDLEPRSGHCRIPGQRDFFGTLRNARSRSPTRRLVCNVASLAARSPFACPPQAGNHCQWLYSWSNPHVSDCPSALGGRFEPIMP